MIRHIVTWGFLEKDADKKSENAAFVSTQLLSLPALIPEIHSMTFGANEVGIDGNWDLVMVADYADEAALRVYLEHPEHIAVVAKIKPLFEKRAAVDFRY